jgi:hypothetical protein
MTEEFELYSTPTLNHQQMHYPLSMILSLHPPLQHSVVTVPAIRFASSPTAQGTQLSSTPAWSTTTISRIATSLNEATPRPDLVNHSPIRHPTAHHPSTRLVDAENSRCIGRPRLKASNYELRYWRTSSVMGLYLIWVLLHE